MGMLSMPYAVMLGGWLSLGALVLAAAVFCLSGLLIVRNFEKVPAGMPQTYPALGERTHASCFTESGSCLTAAAAPLRCSQPSASLQTHTSAAVVASMLSASRRGAASGASPLIRLCARPPVPWSLRRRAGAAGVCALGPPGRYVVGVSTVCEFFGASCIMLVVLWKEVETLMDGRGGARLDLERRERSSAPGSGLH